MRRLLLVLLLAGLAYGGRQLWLAASVGVGFATKVVCSLALVSGVDTERALREYVAAEVAPLGPAVRVSVASGSPLTHQDGGPLTHQDAGAEGSALGLVRVAAVFRPGLGCTLLRGAPLAQAEGVPAPRPALDPSVPWPLGGAGPAVSAPTAVSDAIDRAFAEPDRPHGLVRRTTAVLVARDGRLIAERYAPGYGPATPMLSWSMAKSVTAALVGVEIGDGRLALRAPAPVPEWSSPADPRRAITLDELLRMSSGLAFDETYGALNDVSRMLFLEPDTGAFAARMPLAAPPDTLWSYSSGTANIVARILRDLHGRDLGALVRFANERLFDPAAMTSAFFEPDVSGTPIGSSFVFMTARDWARFGELHRLDGVWSGRRILPEGWVRYVTTPTPAAPRGQYGAHWWLNAGDPQDRAQRPWPGLPTDAYAAEGHSGQHVVVVPSAKLVVVRLGLSVPDDNDHDGTAELVADLIQAFGAAD